MLPCLAQLMSVLVSEAVGKKCASSFCLPPDYNKLNVPRKPTEVATTLYVSDITDVTDEDFSITMYAYVGLRCRVARCPNLSWEFF
jgi:hypothetical protein